MTVISRSTTNVRAQSMDRRDGKQAIYTYKSVQRCMSVTAQLAVAHHDYDGPPRRFAALTLLMKNIEFQLPIRRRRRSKSTESTRK